MKSVEAFMVLMAVVVGVVLIGRRFKIPYPIALVLGGLAISLIPSLPLMRLDPELIFLLFLPPLLFAAAWFTSWHDFTDNLRPILLLAVGLVLFTTIVVGVAAHALCPELPWAVAFALGAIVSPPDAIAATAIAQQMRLPKRIVTILESESLVNDATGLVALRFALVAAASGNFSITHATLEFVWVAVGGVAIGLIVGFALTQISRLIKDDTLLITVTLLAPYAAYLPAERLHVSGVLASVAGGLYAGWKSPEVLSGNTRLHAAAVWEMLVFLLNCVVFVLIGLELPGVVRDLGHHSTGELVGSAAVISAVVILARPLWVFPAAWIPRLLNRRLRERDPIPSWQHLTVVSWSGMRGVVSLAAALALPMTLGSGIRFPERDLVIFLTFCVILATLVFQGLSFPLVIRWLRIKPERDGGQERDVRLKVARAALAHLNRLNEQSQVNETALQLVSGQYEERIRHLSDDLAEALGWSSGREQLVAARRLRREALEAERHELLRLRRAREIDQELLHRIQREIDLEEARLRA